MDDDAPSPAAKAADSDPYAFPDDGHDSFDHGRGYGARGHAAAFTTTTARPNKEMTDPPETGADAHESANDGAGMSVENGTAAGTRELEQKAVGVRTADFAETGDTEMGGVDETERQSGGPKPAELDQLGLKKPPQSDIVRSPRQPPSDVKLRLPQKLKRLRDLHEKQQEDAEEHARPRRPSSADEQSRAALRRALVLALDHVGFSSATNEALESFLLITETYLHSLAEDVSRFALAGRRAQPIPLDFDTSLARFNLGTSSLRPHLRNPIPPSKRTPTYLDPTADPTSKQQPLAMHEYTNLPLLSRELSGKPEKDTKAYIPSSFPDFPSIHTYRHTPVDVDTVTVQGSGLQYEDGSILPPNENDTGNALIRPDGPINRDPKRIREAAAVEAKQAEEALRGLMRASKVNKLKEVRAASDRNSLNKRRYVLWEAAMRELIVEVNGIPAQCQSEIAVKGSSSLREEIADQSMMVNSERAFHRKEIPRKARKVV